MEMRGARVQSLFVLCCTLCSAELSAIEEWLVASFILNVSLCRLLLLTTSSISLVSSIHITHHGSVLDAPIFPIPCTAFSLSGFEMTG